MNYKKKMIILFLSIYLTTFIVYAEKNSVISITEQTTLEGYINYALLNNPGIRAAYNRWKSSHEVIRQVKSLPDPKLNFAYFIKEVETRVGPQKGKIGFMQMFPWFGKLALRGDIAYEMSEIRKERIQKLKLKLTYKFKKAWYELYYINRALLIIEENQQLLEYLEGVMRVKYTTGQASHSNLIKVQVELDKLRDLYSTTADMRQPVIAQLNSLLNREPNKQVFTPSVIDKYPIYMSKKEIVKKLRRNNPDLKIVDHKIKRDKTRIKLARKNYYPDISLGLDYIFTEKSLMPDVKDNGKNPLVAMMSINIPLRFSKYNAALKEAQLSQRAEELQRKQRENQLIAKVEMSFFKIKNADRKISLYKDSLIPKAEKAFAVTQSAFESGKVDFMNLIDSQRILLGFSLAYERSLTTFNQTTAELEMFIGHDLTQKKRGVQND